MTPAEHLDSLATSWRRPISAALRSFRLAIVVAVLFAGAHLARLGTPVARGAVGIAFAVAVAGMVAAHWRDRRDFADPRRTISRTLVPTDRALGAGALRAIDLVQETRRDATLGSADLAALHFERLLRRASRDAVEHIAGRRAKRWRWLSTALAATALGAVAAGPFRVVEGLDVLMAVRGVGPLPLEWLSSVRVTTQSPAYLREPDRRLFLGAASLLPIGTQITVAGVPIHEGRALVLSDGDEMVPFVDDGKGGVVARWTVEGATELRVAARFGSVRIDEPDPLWIAAVPDEPPRVELWLLTATGGREPAPRTLSLSDVDRIGLEYSAVDDHGLRAVDVVLRAGTREDRRALARLDGESAVDAGGYTLSASDPFLKRAFVPVAVTVEARDGDPSRSTWGVSPAITVLPPAVGEPEAERYRRLYAARDAVAALLAWQTRRHAAGDVRPPAKFRDADGLRVAAIESLRASVAPQRGRLDVPGGLATFLLGQASVLASRVPPGGSPLRATEDVMLAVDKAIRALALRDARTVAKRLGDVAEEAADGAHQARATDARAAGTARLDSALTALDEGAQALMELGVLGLDVGSVARGDTGRIRRARGREALAEAEQAARHLAARLRRPNPSFGTSESSRRSGVESGMLGAGEAAGEPSRADQGFDQLADEVAELAREHADEMDRVERALREAEQAVSLDQARQEARARADAVRRAAADLPLVGARPGSAAAAAALAREHAGAMAHSLEQLSVGDAVESGRDALAALDSAKSRSAAEGSRADEEAIERARREVKDALEWAERLLGKLRAEAAQRAKGALGSSAARERELSQRAGNLGSRGRIRESALPEDLIDNLDRAASAMAEAADALQRGDGERGLERQREAQRLLEQTDRGKTSDHDGDAKPPASPGSSPDGNRMPTDGSVPGEGRDGAEDFRRRVLEGLGKDRGRLGDAVQRYAETLLR